MNDRFITAVEAAEDLPVEVQNANLNRTFDHLKNVLPTRDYRTIGNFLERARGTFDVVGTSRLDPNDVKIASGNMVGPGPAIMVTAPNKELSWVPWAGAVKDVDTVSTSIYAMLVDVGGVQVPVAQGPAPAESQKGDVILIPRPILLPPGATLILQDMSATATTDDMAWRVHYVEIPLGETPPWM